MTDNVTSGGSAAGTTSVPEVRQTSEEMVSKATMQSVIDRMAGEKGDIIRAKERTDRELALAQQTIAELKGIVNGTPQDEGGGTRTTPATERTTPPTAETRTQERLSPEELQRMVRAEAEAMDFTKQCNEAVVAGRKAHDDFDKTVMEDLTRLSPIYDPRVGQPILPRTLIEAALETGNASEVLYALGKDTKEAERIMRLSPIRQAVEVAKFHASLAPASIDDEGDEEEPAPTDVEANENLEIEGEPPAQRATPARKPPPAPQNTSRAPVPHGSGARRAGGGVRPAFNLLDPKKSDTATWMREREKDLAQKRANGQYRGR